MREFIRKLTTAFLLAGIACFGAIACLPPSTASDPCLEPNHPGWKAWSESETPLELTFAGMNGQQLVFRQVQTVRKGGGKQTELLHARRAGTRNKVSCRAMLTQKWVSENNNIVMHQSLVYTNTHAKQASIGEVPAGQSNREPELTLSISIQYRDTAHAQQTFRYYLSPASHFLASRTQSVEANGTTLHSVLVAESPSANQFEPGAPGPRQDDGYPLIVSTYVTADTGLVAFGTAEGKIYTKLATP